MTEAFTILLILYSMMRCVTFDAPPVIWFGTYSPNVFSAMKQAAQPLNVSFPANWRDYMSIPMTDGSVGQAQVGIPTLAKVMASWSIPEEFRADAVEKVKILVAAATEGSYTVQAFTFNTQAGALLTTLLIGIKKLDSPSIRYLPVVAAYITMNTMATIKNQYTLSYTDRCFQCITERDLTPEELIIIKQRMSFDQFEWFNERTSSSLVKRSLSESNENNNGDISLTKAIENYLADNIVKAEILTSYNDSVLTALQSNITSLKLSSQSLKLTKVEYENIAKVLKELVDNYGFDDISSSQQLQLPRFSYEKLFTSRTNNEHTTNVTIKYIWLLGQNHQNSTYTIHFFFLNITSQTLIDTLLYHNGSKNDDRSGMLDIVRTSILNDNGQFFSEHVPRFITPWVPKTANVALNILRFISASVFVPQRRRMLSYFSSRIVTPETDIKNVPDYRARAAPVAALATVTALAEGVTAVANAWSAVANALKTTTSTTITRLTRFGFQYFHQKSSTLKALDIPSSKVSEFVNAIILDYNLPSKSTFLLGVTYSTNFAWDKIDYIYSPTMNGTYRSLTVFKNGDSTKNTASFFIVDIDTKWVLAPDLLLIRKSTSYVGGIFEETKESIQEVPHALTMDEAVKLQQFFSIIAMGNMATTLGINVTYPSLT